MKYRVVAIKQVEQIIEADSQQEAVESAFFRHDWKFVSGDYKATLLSVSWENEE